MSLAVIFWLRIIGSEKSETLLQEFLPLDQYHLSCEYSLSMHLVPRAPCTDVGAGAEIFK